MTCGGGVQSRTVQCLVQGKPSSGCAFHLKPLISQACNTNFCPQPDKKGTIMLLSLSKREGINYRRWANKVSFFILPQMWLVGITSTGATWFLNMESATTSSTASSAASPAQTQTYKPSPSPQRCPHSDVSVFVWRVAGEDITVEVWEDLSAISFPRDAGHLETKSWCWQHCAGMRSGQYD